MNPTNKKTFGQFFSGEKVGRLLVSLIPSGAQFSAVIDPMAGEGDLLSAATKRGCKRSVFVGVEIDPKVADVCKRKVPFASISIGDAFTSPAMLRNRGYDTVLANPPYIRYQLQKEQFSVDSIRSSLVKLLSTMTHLPSNEKSLFLELANSYAGTADMAVPSWILCAALLAHGGWLAIVVPETWLSRDYALPIQYMLLKLFDIHFVVRDISAKWFSDALVRTCLVVAQRKPLTTIKQSFAGKTFKIDVGSGVSNDTSLVGNLHVGKLRGSQAWMSVLNFRQEVQQESFSSTTISTKDLFPNLPQAAKSSFIEPDDQQILSDMGSLPYDIRVILPSPTSSSFLTIQDYGLQCGQGLRTGANDFFYLQKSNPDDGSLVCSWNGGSYQLPTEVCIPVLQNQSEISSLVVRPQHLSRVLFYCGNRVRLSDSRLMTPSSVQNVAILSESAAQLIEDAERDFVKNGKKIFELSAVKPNIRKLGNYYQSFWYQLPRLASRHLPNLCVPRINGGAVSCVYVNQTTKLAVDANFSTLWAPRDVTLAFFCILNSLWFKYYSEIIGTVMGGGALKLEASTIRKVLFPRFSSEQLEALGTIAKRILGKGSISKKDQSQIDAIVLSPLGDNWKTVQSMLQNRLEQLLNNRRSK